MSQQELQELVLQEMDRILERLALSRAAVRERERTAALAALRRLGRVRTPRDWLDYAEGNRKRRTA